ncbi:MAG: hypothetical protein O2954_04865 [bacterium]|nr:hypothetical protein [bacterium]
MTQLECFQATVEHRPHEGLLFYANFTPDLERRVREANGLDDKTSLRDFFGMYHPTEIGPRAPEGLAKPDFWTYYEDLDIPAGSYLDGHGVLHTPGSMYHFTHYVSPLRNAQNFEDLESFPYPHVNGFTEDHMATQVEAIHAAGKIASGWTGHMYETAWQIRGYEPFLIDMALQPEWCEYILDRLTERNLKVAEAAARAGIDVLRTGDDVANQNTLMFSIEQWRKLMKPRWAKVCEAARRIKPDIQIWYHSDGNIEDIIPELIEIGITILNPVQPECMDPLHIKKKFGDKIVIDGTIGTQTTMPFGSPDEVRKIVHERVQTLAGDGAFIASPTHVLEPEVPLENLNAFVETAKAS